MKKVCRGDIINNVKEFEMKRFILVVISCIFVVALAGGIALPRRTAA